MIKEKLGGGGDRVELRVLLEGKILREDLRSGDSLG